MSSHNEQSDYTLLDVPEVRDMVRLAREYLAGRTHFSALHAAAAECLLWLKVYKIHSGIRQLADDWTKWTCRRWNEWGQHAEPLTDQELRALIAADLALTCQVTTAGRDRPTQ